MPPASSPKAAPKPTHTTRVTNGSELLAGVDGRTLWARRLRDVYRLYLSDLGGEGDTSEAERAILRRAATLTVQLERMEQDFAREDPGAPALDLYQRTAGNLRRLLETTGIRRRPRDVTPTLDQYLEMA